MSYFFNLFKNTQKESWQKLQEIHGDDIKEKILQSYQKQVELDSLDPSYSKRIHSIRNQTGLLVSKTRKQTK